jgi:2-haloalkanoic acid dehalogenase type II
MPSVAPALFSFDIFGTVVDWLGGMRDSLHALGRTLSVQDFERVIDFQGAEERRGPFRSYREIAARSLTEVLGIAPADAERIGAQLGSWKLFPDSAQGLRRLQARAPCVALTNSDRIHGEQVQAQLGFRLTDWVCAEEVRCYKPSPGFWRAAAARREVELNRAWWHVSAYADYDLEVARSLGLTCVLVRREHHRAGAADWTVADLGALADLLC